MRLAYGLVLVLVACGEDGNMFPVGGGGTDGGLVDSGGQGTIDARLVDAKVIDGAPATIDAAILSGRVCLLTDARDPESCASTGAANLTVHIGSNVAITAADGTFKIPAGTGTWSVTGPNIVSSFKVKNDYFIPAMTRTMYDALIAANGIDLRQGEGSIMVHVIRNGAGYAGATAASAAQPNPAKYLPFYDNDANQNDWNQIPSTANAVTGSQGAVWLVGFDVGDATFTITPPAGGGTAVTEAGQPVIDQAITWDDVIINN